MTTLREAAQQALTILEAWKHKGMWGDWDGVTDALKAALVEDAMQKFTDVNQELQAALGCDHCNSPLYAAIKCRVCGRETPIIEPEIKGDNKPDVADDLALIVRNAIAYINRLERQINELKRAAPPQRKPEPNSDYERGFVDGMSEQARRSVDKAVNAMTKCKPLAEEEIARLVTNDMVKFAREIERAHGITP